MIDSDDDLFDSLPVTLEEFTNVSETKSSAMSKTQLKKKEKEEVFKVEDSDSDGEDNFVDDDEEEEEIVPKKKPATKRTFKAAAKPETETKKPKSESLESTEAEATPKKKFK